MTAKLKLRKLQAEFPVGAAVPVGYKHFQQQFLRDEPAARRGHAIAWFGLRFD